MKHTSKLIEKKRSSDQVYDGKLLKVFVDEVELPDGSSSTRDWIKHPGACAVVPIFDNGDILLIEQFRYCCKQVFIEVPAGKIDKNESPDKTAERELKEETGILADNIHYIGHFYPAIGYSDEVIHIYAAKNLKVEHQNPDDDEFVTLLRIPFTEAMQMIETGEITDGKSIVCLQRVWNWMQAQE
jgi:ADP-ribose pyrophosphatase